MSIGMKKDVVAQKAFFEYQIWKGSLIVTGNLSQRIQNDIDRKKASSRVLIRNVYESQ